MAAFASRRGFFTSVVAACLAALGVRPRRIRSAPVLPPAADGMYRMTAMVYDGRTRSSQTFTWVVSPGATNAGTQET